MPYSLDSSGSERPPAAVSTLAYDGWGGDVASIAISNALLTLVTVGFYRFWGKTRLRRYLWGHISYLGDRLEYTGTAKELLWGFLAVLIILAPFVGFSYWFSYYFADNTKLIVAKEVVQAFVILFLIQIAIFRARRYRLSRTLWRGIRGGQTGSALKYGLIFSGWMIALALSLFLAYPFFNTSMQRYRTENTWFGDMRLAFDAQARDLFASWFLVWSAIPVIIGLGYLQFRSFDPTGVYSGLMLLASALFWFGYLWYRVKEFRYFTENTSLGDLWFESSLGVIRVLIIYIIYGIVFFLLMLGFAGALHLGVPVVMEWGLSPEQIEAMTEAEHGNRASLVMIPFIVLLVVSINVAHIVFYIHPLLHRHMPDPDGARDTGFCGHRPKPAKGAVTRRRAGGYHWMWALFDRRRLYRTGTLL